MNSFSSQRSANPDPGTVAITRSTSLAPSFTPMDDLTQLLVHLQARMQISVKEQRVHISLSPSVTKDYAARQPVLSSAPLLTSASSALLHELQASKVLWVQQRGMRLPYRPAEVFKETGSRGYGIHRTRGEQLLVCVLEKFNLTLTVQAKGTDLFCSLGAQATSDPAGKSPLTVTGQSVGGVATQMARRLFGPAPVWVHRGTIPWRLGKEDLLRLMKTDRTARSLPPITAS